MKVRFYLNLPIAEQKAAARKAFQFRSLKLPRLSPALLHPLGSEGLTEFVQNYRLNIKKPKCAVIDDYC